MDCIFCKIVNKEIDSKIIYEDDVCMAILDANPVVDGHTLIIPKDHYEDFTKLPLEIMAHLQRVAEELAITIQSKLNETGCALIVNYGSNISVPHFHLHLLPGFKYEENKTYTKSLFEVYKILTK